MRTLPLVLFAMSLSAIAAADEWSVGRTVPAGEWVSPAEIDHTLWDADLQKYVDADGRVDYRQWKADGTESLDRYLAELSRGDLTAQTSQEAKLAFWINAYNAVTVRGILREYPTTSIRNHTAKLWGYNIWEDLLLPVGGRRFSLEQIEHEVLRKMDEPRIHFAIVCASVGCPRLLNRAYTPADVDEQLEMNAQDFFARPQNFRMDGDTVYLSSILDWFGEDFGDSTGQVLGRIRQWVPEADRDALSGRVNVKYLDYDWDLNSQ